MAGFIAETRTFLEDVRDQMRKVTWPDWPQLQNSTFIIIVFVTIVTLVIFGMDFFVSRALAVVRSIFGG